VLLVSLVEYRYQEKTYTKYWRLDRRSLFLHALSSSFASTRRSTSQSYVVTRRRKTYIELPGEGRESALSIDQWQNLLR
jgi:hypothetical protein